MLNKKTEQIIQRAFSEDKLRQDKTTRLTVSKQKKGRAIIIAKEKGIFCGRELAAYIFKKIDSQINIKFFKKDGDRVAAGEKTVAISGNLQAILKGERASLNFLSLLSGVATTTNLFIEQVKKTKVIVKDTRKTTPGLRELEKYAVSVGGGINHRHNLAAGIIVKDNHLKAAGIIDKNKKINHLLLKQSLTKLKKKTNFPIEIEVETFNEFTEIAKHRPDIIMLDNFSKKNLRKAVDYRNKNFPKIKLEASGGIQLKNIKTIALTGVDFISIGSLTHSPKALDFSLELI